jgi:hypothetical protein
LLQIFAASGISCIHDNVKDAVNAVRRPERDFSRTDANSDEARGKLTGRSRENNIIAYRLRGRVP